MKTTLLLLLLSSAVAVSAAVPAEFWGNYAGNWKQTLKEITEGNRVSSAKTPEIPSYPTTKITVWSWLGKYGGEKMSPEQTNNLRVYVEKGGVLVLYGAVPAILFSGRNIYDLAPGAELLGASAYQYGKPDSKASPSAEKIFGADARRCNPYPELKNNHPFLGKICGMQILFGSKNAAQLGVTRIGKGAMVYSSLDPKPGTPYAEAILKLMNLLLDEKSMQQYFPVPAGNQAVLIDGKPLHLAVVNGEAASTRFLQQTLTRMTGKTDFRPSPTAPQITIHTGMTPYVKSLNLDFEKLHPFGYYMFFRDGKNMILAGKTPRGTMFAVNDFLKRYAGYRNYASGELFEIVPKQAAIRIPSNFEFKEEPSVNSYHLAYSPNVNFGRNSRLNCMATHALDNLVPPKLYANTHPEYYPEVNGKRKRIHPESKNSPWNPCISNPDLPKLVAEYADRYFKENPDRFGLPLGVNDGGGDCQCAKCLEVFQRTGNQYAEFYNMAAKVLAKKYPDKVISFIAYSRTASDVPRGVRMEPNILVEITGMGRSAFAEMPKWKDAGIRHFGIYDYLYTLGGGYVTPRYYPRFMAKTWRDAWKKHTISTMWMEYYPRTAVFEAPRQYVLDELAWNMNADVDALLKDYFTNMYAEAAPAVQRFFDLLEDVYTRKKDADVPIRDWKKNIQMEEYTFQDLERLDKELAAAKSLGKDPSAKKRLAILEKLYSFCRLNIINYLCSRELSQIKTVASQEDCTRILNRIQCGYSAIADLRAFEMTPEEQRLVFLGKQTFQEFKNQSTLNPLPLLEKNVDPVLAKVTKYLETSNINVEQYYTKAAKQSTSKEFRSALLTQLYLKKNKLVNIVKNPSFEDGGKTEEKRIAIGDHQEFKGVPHWSTWTFPNSLTHFFRNREAAHTGKYSGAIGERQIGGTLINYVTLEPGCRYRFGFWVRRNRGDDGFGCGDAGIRMQRNGVWLDQGSAIKVPFPPESENRWVPLETTFTAPSGDAAVALLLFSAPPQPAGVWTAIDDVSIEKIFDPAFFKEIMQ